MRRTDENLNAKFAMEENTNMHNDPVMVVHAQKKAWSMFQPRLAVLLFLIYIRTLSGSTDWILEKKSDGIEVYTKGATGTSMVAFRGITEDSMAVEIIAGTLLDIPGYGSWMSNVSESKIIRRTDSDHFLVYQRFDFLWPFRDRDIVAEISITRDYRTGKFLALIRAVNDSTVPGVRNCIRMSTMTGEIEITYLRRNRTRVVYSESFDPAGNFTALLAQAVSSYMPRLVLGALRKKVRDRPDGNFPEISEVREGIERSIREGLLPK